MKDISYTKYSTLENCESEPLSFLGSIQPFGVLIAYDLEKDSVEFCSENIQGEIGVSLERILGLNFNKLQELLGFDSDVGKLSQKNTKNLSNLNVNNKEYSLTVKKENSHLIFEFELLPDGVEAQHDFYLRTNDFINKINEAESFYSFSTSVADEIRRIIDYDRVMIYRFDPDYNGEVYAESKRNDLEPFLGLNYPHTDIPAQARELYKKQSIRMIPDVNYTPTSILAHAEDSTYKDLDISKSILRSVSPIHIKYLQNMGVAATLTISILINDQLWGMIACHNYSPKKVLLYSRTSALMQSEFYAAQIHRWERSEEYKKVQEKEHIYQSILEEVVRSGNTFESVSSTPYFLGLTDATGGAILREGKVHVYGETPNVKFILDVQRYMKSNNERVFLSNTFSDYLEEAEKYRNVASGVLYFSLDKESDSAVIWFRKQLSEGKKWGGNPNNENVKSLTPRNSFKAWEENVAGKSKKWYSHEIQAGLRLGNYLEREIYIRNLKSQKEQLEQITNELKSKNEELSQFNWISSHDMKEPLRKIRLFIDQIGMEEQELSEIQQNYFTRIDKAAERMQQLINDLLNYAKLNDEEVFERKSLKLVAEKVVESISSLEDDELNFELGDLPEANIIDFQIAQLFSNLISNSIKFKHPERSVLIKIITESPTANDLRELGLKKGEFIKIIYSDNGIGFSSEYNERIFKVFQRLHDTNKFAGTGIGLAICKKIVETHNGFIRAKGKEGVGVVFEIFLKK
jgi:light-regulated signal transduction histidine kinase (bacteriophytochrome)